MKRATLLSALVCLCSFSALSTESKPFPLERLAGQHPRLFFDAQRVSELRPTLNTSHQFLWRRFQEDVPRMVAIAEGTTKANDARYEGDLIADLAFAWTMTGDARLLEAAKKQLLRLALGSQWSSDEDVIYLIPSHFLTGLALGYDWLYPVLSETERSGVATRLGKEAAAQYESITKGRVWWRNQYFQNHSHSNYCGLALAATALYGEDPRAGLWLETCRAFFKKVFEVMPSDGGSLEGYAYAGYGAEYILMYAMISRDLLGEDYTSNPWMRHLSQYLVQGLLPVRREQEWAMTFGDAPRRGWTSTAQHLFLLARLYRDPAAQWMACETVELPEHGLGSRGWMMLLYYDPTVAPASPANFPPLYHFPEIDQVMMRSSWADHDATLVGFKCGPFMGKTLSRTARFDYGTGHEETDAGSFQIFSHGSFLAIDPLYLGYKLTGNYNTMLLKGTGQMGEQAGFGSAEALRFGHYPEIVMVKQTPDVDYVVGDVTRAYHPALGVKKHVRQLLFLKPHTVLVADTVDLSEKGVVYYYAPEEIKTAGGLKHAPNGYVVGAEGEAYIEFAGTPGSYQVAVIYLDNAPERGNYSLQVDGKTVGSWKSRNEEIDDNLIEVLPPVELKKGSRISFIGAPMAPECRLTKMIVFSDSAKGERKAQWLMQVDPAASVKQEANNIRVTLGRAGLDLYSLLPARAIVRVENHPIKKADVEPFSFRTTQRIVVEPEMPGETVTLLNLLQMRGANEPGLESVRAEQRGSAVEVSWKDKGRARTIKWDLEHRQFSEH